MATSEASGETRAEPLPGLPGLQLAPVVDWLIFDRGEGFWPGWIIAICGLSEEAIEREMRREEGRTT